jgi:hypothetical protein
VASACWTIDGNVESARAEAEMLTATLTSSTLAAPEGLTRRSVAFQHELRELGHHAPLLADHGDQRRHHMAALGVLPADQGLHREAAARLQVHLRLKMNLEHIAVQRRTQVALEFVAVDDGLVRVQARDHDPVLPGGRPAGRPGGCRQPAAPIGSPWFDPGHQIQAAPTVGLELARRGSSPCSSGRWIGRARVCLSVRAARTRPARRRADRRGRKRRAPGGRRSPRRPGSVAAPTEPARPPRASRDDISLPEPTPEGGRNGR